MYKKLRGLACIPATVSVSMENALALEYIEGEHYFDAKTLRDALKYMLLLLKAIQDIHNKSVVHSDLKFGNVIYNAATSTLKVIDLAYSTISKKDMLVHCAGYTERYAVPEVRERSQVGFASDIFSAGLMFTSLIVDDEDYKFFQQLLHRKAPNKFNCPQASQIAQQMTAGDWMQRFTASGAIEQILKLQPELATLIN